MELYKITIKPVTSFCSPLQSDTFFGAFCWSFLYRFGEQALQELLYHCKIGKPDIIFSNAFPSGRLPMPLGIEDNNSEIQNSLTTKQEKYERYISNKKKDHLSDITLDDFNAIINGIQKPLSVHSNSDCTITSWRNMINRKSSTVESSDDRGSLFEMEETYSTGEYDIYVYSTLERDVLNCILKEMFQSGIGAQRSVGKGAFDVVGELEPCNDFKIPEKTNAFVALSNFVPQKEDPTKGHYKTLLKYPKVSYISSEKDSPFKKPLIFLKAGSVFFDHPVKMFYGSCIEKVALKDGIISDKIVINAYTIAIPCYIDY